MFSPDITKAYLTDKASRIREIERLGYTDPQATSAAILHSHYRGGFWDARFAHVPFSSTLLPLLSETQIVTDKPGSTSTRGRIDTYLTHFISAIAAYDNPSVFLKVAIGAFGIDPGIKIKHISRHFPNGLTPSFWNALGGDMLTDWVYGDKDEDEYRAGLLGLKALKEQYLPSLGRERLSEMVFAAAENLNAVRGDNYKSLPDFQIADRSIRPFFGHYVIRWLTKNIGFFQKNALIPVERAYLT